MKIELEQEDDGRWIAEFPQVPGAMAYGGTQAEAIMKVEALVLQTQAMPTRADLARSLFGRGARWSPERDSVTELDAERAEEG